MRRITGKATSVGGIAAFMLINMVAGCGTTSAKKTANTDSVPTVPVATTAPGTTTTPIGTGPISSTTTGLPQPTLANQYQSYMVALTNSPAWTIVEAQVAPQNAYMANYSGTAPTVTAAQLAAVTFEIHAVSAELHALSRENQSNVTTANIDADTQIEDVSIELNSIPNDVSSGIDVADDINMVHGDDAQARTLLQLTPQGPGAVAAVANPSS